MQKLSEVSEITIGQQYLTEDGVVVEAVEDKDGDCFNCYFDDEEYIMGISYCHNKCVFHNCLFKKVE